MELYYSKAIYPKTALLKAAYNFTDDYYIHIDADDKNYIVKVSAKDKNKKSDIAGMFDNELLVQSARYHISEQTKNIRELILSRAFASTVIENHSKQVEEEETTVDIDKILTDWFEINE